MAINGPTSQLRSTSAKAATNTGKAPRTTGTPTVTGNEPQGPSTTATNAFEYSATPSNSNIPEPSNSSTPSIYGNLGFTVEVDQYGNTKRVDDNNADRAMQIDARQDGKTHERNADGSLTDIRPNRR